MSAAALAVAQGTAPNFPALEVSTDEQGTCDSCGHPKSAHELLLTATHSYVICHERTGDGECFRVRHSRGIAFGACRRDPA